MPDTERLDAIIIGTGQAGKPLAGALAEAGWKTAIVERGRVGGSCVLTGCTPTKTMVASARVAHLARRAGDYGVRTGAVQVDLAVVRERKRRVVDQFSGRSERGLTRHDTLELVFGEARFVGEREVEVALREGGARRLAAEHIFLDTGTRTRVPSIPGLAAFPFLDNASVMELDEPPEHLLILGGGFIGLEFGQMFRRFGSEVTIIQRPDRLARREDPEISEAIEEIFREDGITVLTATTAERVAGSAGRVEVEVTRDGRRDVVRGSHLLVAVGRTPNTEALELTAAGIATDERGYVRVNERLETSAPGVWALGEVAGSPQFTHVAYDDYRVVRANLLEGGSRTTAARIIPYTLFIDPQLGRVGLTEAEAREAGFEVEVATLPMSKVARAIERDETRGLTRAVVNARDGRILGAAVLGIEGGEVVAVIQSAMMGDLPYTALRDGIFAHPTVAEVVNTVFMTM